VNGARARMVGCGAGAKLSQRGVMNCSGAGGPIGVARGPGQKKRRRGRKAPPKKKQTPATRSIHRERTFKETVNRATGRSAKACRTTASGAWRLIKACFSHFHFSASAMNARIDSAGIADLPRETAQSVRRRTRARSRSRNRERAFGWYFRHMQEV